MPMNEEVFGKVREALVDALGVDDDEVTEDATMVGDLGAESIDFLDIGLCQLTDFPHPDHCLPAQAFEHANNTDSEENVTITIGDIGMP